jgi:hypothetical protein
MVLLPSPRHWSECPEHGQQREYLVNLLPDISQGQIKGLVFMLRECAVLEGIKNGDIDPRGVQVPQELTP